MTNALKPSLTLHTTERRPRDLAQRTRPKALWLSAAVEPLGDARYRTTAQGTLPDGTEFRRPDGSSRLRVSATRVSWKL